MSPYANAPPVKKLTSRDLVIFGLEVARGMEYIASQEVSLKCDCILEFLNVL